MSNPSPISITPGGRKVSVSGLAGAITIAGTGTWDYVLNAAHPIPATLATAYTVLIMVGLFFVIPEKYQTN